MSRQYSIWIVSPPGYTHSRCFEEVACALHEAFASLGYQAPIVTDPAQIVGCAIVLGANLLPSLAIPLPRRLVIFNLEQIQQGSVWMKPAYIDLLRRYPVWDYSVRNLERLRELEVPEVTLCGIGYTPGLTRIEPLAPDIDVLFVGSLNDRRRGVLEAIARRGKKVVAAFDVYGEKRDKLIAAANVVLNVHFFEAQVFEIVRVSYLLANRKCVVSETGFDDALEAPFRDALAFAPYAQLADTCLDLLERPAERARLAAAGFERFSAQSQVTMLERALAGLPAEF